MSFFITKEDKKKYIKEKKWEDKVNFYRSLVGMSTYRIGNENTTRIEGKILDIIINDKNIMYMVKWEVFRTALLTYPNSLTVVKKYKKERKIK